VRTGFEDGLERTIRWYLESFFGENTVGLSR
jgi:hypothetical protein